MLIFCPPVCCVDSRSWERQPEQMEEVMQTIANRQASPVPTIREKRIRCRSSTGDIVAFAPCLGKALGVDAVLSKSDGMRQLATCIQDVLASARN
jgi:hypothetical protein